MIKPGSLVTSADGNLWRVGETAVRGGEGEIARCWPRKIRTAPDGVQYAGSHPDFPGYGGDQWFAVGDLAEVEEVTI